MNYLWKYIEKSAMTVEMKSSLFICMSAIICGLAGALVWLMFVRWILPGTMWLICFTGYPMAIGGIFGGILYLWRHEFS